jgi:predicted RNA-binding protein associated with RNAse of E/G family
VSWLPSGEHWGWYVNLQEPFERTAGGFRTMDLVLDVIVDPDLTWRWKDEDELAVFVERGVVDEALERRIRGEALRVIADAQARRAPFGEDWQAWRPDADWGLPELPAGWDECP